jgi:chromosome segregation ATPase
MSMKEAVSRLTVELALAPRRASDPEADDEETEAERDVLDALSVQLEHEEAQMAELEQQLAATQDERKQSDSRIQSLRSLLTAASTDADKLRSEVKTLKAQVRARLLRLPAGAPACLRAAEGAGAPLLTRPC